MSITVVRREAEQGSHPARTTLGENAAELSCCALAQVTSCKLWGHSNATTLLTKTSPDCARENWKLPALLPAGSQLLVMHVLCLSSPTSDSFPGIGLAAPILKFHFPLLHRRKVTSF